MGFTPQQAGAMSVWQYMATIDGFLDANSSEENKGLSSTERDELWDFVEMGS